MCDTYVNDKTVSRDTNMILKTLQCIETRKQLGHCVVFDKEGHCNVPGMSKHP